MTDSWCRCGAWRGSLGLEPTPHLYVQHIVEVFRQVRRVLRRDGTLWLNMGDCYATGAGKVGEHPGGGEQGARWRGDIDRIRDEKGYRGTHLPDDPHKSGGRAAAMGPMTQPNRMPLPGLKPKDMVGIPWRVVFALQEDGWWLRSDIIWSKSNPMPESVTDRPTKAHEYLFLLGKAERYYYDADAIREPHKAENWHDLTGDGYSAPGQTSQCGNRKLRGIDPFVWRNGEKYGEGDPGSFTRMARYKTVDDPNLRGVRQAPEPGEPNAFHPLGRNKRTVWEIATQPYPEAHFATFPEALVEPCVLAGTSEGGACSKCGTPWVHRVLAEGGTIGRDWNEHSRGEADLRIGHTKVRKAMGDVFYEGYRRHDLGYEPGCACGDPPKPSVVLDPFAGSGTTLFVAQRLGRSAVGVEVNPRYCELARRRIEPHHSQTRLVFR